VVNKRFVLFSKIVDNYTLSHPAVTGTYLTDMLGPVLGLFYFVIDVFIFTITWSAG